MVLLKILRLRQHAHIHIIIRHRRELVFVQQQDQLCLYLFRQLQQLNFGRRQFDLINVCQIIVVENINRFHFQSG